MKEISLPSGATLKFQLAPFADAKELFQAVLKEVRTVEVDSQDDLNVNVIKDLFCAGFTSKEVEAALIKCLKRCTYNDTRITKLDEIFEAEDARQDFMVVMYEVTMENIAPFVKSLFARLSPLLAMLSGKANSSPA